MLYFDQSEFKVVKITHKYCCLYYSKALITDTWMGWMTACVNIEISLHHNITTEMEEQLIYFLYLFTTIREVQQFYNKIKLLNVMQGFSHQKTISIQTKIIPLY